MTHERCLWISRFVSEGLITTKNSKEISLYRIPFFETVIGEIGFNGTVAWRFQEESFEGDLEYIWLSKLMQITNYACVLRQFANTSVLYEAQ